MWTFGDPSVDWRRKETQHQQHSHAMRPSISVTLEPGLDRGVPWGRDLYTFVTSAAGHMMRTLQKPRKNRPSKRQVNHRRFLHNMIQRKFADIEASNHRPASSLCSYSHEDQASFRCDADAASGATLDLQTSDAAEKKQEDGGHLWKRQQKVQNRSKKLTGSRDPPGSTSEIHELLDEVQTSDLEPGSDPSCSPLFQKFHEDASCWSDMLDLLGTDFDVDEYFENVSDDAFKDPLAHLSHGITRCEPENFLWPVECDDGCHGNQEWARSNDVIDERQHESFQDGRERYSCMMQTSGDASAPTPFEGVARSFPASVQTHEPRLSSGLPGEDDWLFSDILGSCGCC